MTCGRRRRRRRSGSPGRAAGCCIPPATRWCWRRSAPSPNRSACCPSAPPANCSPASPAGRERAARRRRSGAGRDRPGRAGGGPGRAPQSAAGRRGRGGRRARPGRGHFLDHPYAKRSRRCRPPPRRWTGAGRWPTAAWRSTRRNPGPGGRGRRYWARCRRHRPGAPRQLRMLADRELLTSRTGTRSPFTICSAATCCSRPTTWPAACRPAGRATGPCYPRWDGGR